MTSGRPTIGQSGGEFAFIRRVLSRCGAAPASVITGAGHDAAVLRLGSDAIVTTDMLVEGRHFLRHLLTPEEIGWRSAVASLSDIAAMGGRPEAGFLSLGVPPDYPAEEAEQVCAGLIQALEASGASLAGGDTVECPCGLVISLCLIGSSTGRSPLRSGARAGDVLCVTGTLGGSRAGLALLLKLGSDEARRRFPALVACHGRPEARLAAGQWLSRQSAVHAMMDLSDGLAADVRRLAEAGGVGVCLDESALPAHPDLAAASEVTGELPQRTALAGGEDFELLFAADAACAADVLAGVRQATGLPACQIGRVVESGIAVERDGRFEPLEEGFEHFR